MREPGASPLAFVTQPEEPCQASLPPAGQSQLLPGFKEGELELVSVEKCPSCRRTSMHAVAARSFCKVASPGPVSLPVCNPARTDAGLRVGAWPMRAWSAAWLWFRLALQRARDLILACGALRKTERLRSAAAVTSCLLTPDARASCVVRHGRCDHSSSA